MSRVLRLAISTTIAVLLAAPLVLTDSVYTRQLTNESLATYFACPDPSTFCLLHGETAEFMGGCDASGVFAPTCFERTSAEALTVMAVDDQGDFPKTFFAWHGGNLAPWEMGYPCTLTERGKKTLVDISDGEVKCSATLVTGDHIYYEHFSSNPARGRVCWGECRVPVPPTH